MTEVEEIKRLKVAKVKALKSFLFFTRYFFKAQYKRKFIIGKHHQVIAEALERVVRGECKRLIIQVAPRFGKTELAVKAFISYCLALNPSAKFIHLSYSDDLALDNSETIKDLVQSEEYQAMFPAVKIKHDSKAKNKWYTTEGGGMLARAAGGSVTGFGAGKVDQEDQAGKEMFDSNRLLEEFDEWILERKQQFAGAIVIDDPVKPEDADSETIRNRVNSRFDSTIRTRANSRDTPIIVIMQRTHPEDLAGYLQRDNEADKWEVISLPVINDDGTALWPHKMTVEEARAFEKANDLVFQRQYMQNPKPKTGLLFPIDELKFYDPAELETILQDPDFCYICADPADEGGDDFASGPFKLIGDKVYVTDMIYNTKGTDHNEKAVEDLVSTENPSCVGIEGVLGWEETAKRIRTALWERGFKKEFRILQPRKNKHTRITNRAAFIRNNFVFRSDWQERPEYAKFMRNLTSYQKIQEAATKNKHDDGPDLCEMAGVYYERNFPHLWALKPRT
jgi:predicted phage terminase large subunit-like protein